jgi:hypothetical protein
LIRILVILKDILDKRRHENILDLERLNTKGKLNCGKVFHFIHQLDERLEKYHKTEEEKKWYLLENVGKDLRGALTKEGGSYDDFFKGLRRKTLGIHWRKVGDAEIQRLTQ